MPTGQPVQSHLAQGQPTQIPAGGSLERSGSFLFVLPVDFQYSEVTGLSNEVREKLERIRPDSIGQASRIAGMTPAAISLLLIHLKKRELRRSA